MTTMNNEYVPEYVSEHDLSLPQVSDDNSQDITDEDVPRYVPDGATEHLEERRKTLFCRSVRNGTVCPHLGKKCRFAHHVDEISFVDCKYGYRCRYAIRENYKWKNTGTDKVCTYIHPRETSREYCKRLLHPTMYVKMFKSGCAGVIVRHKDSYLMVYGRKHKKWSFPKGKVMLGETLRMAAERETKEETGIDIDLQGPLREFRIYKNTYYHYDWQGELPIPNPRDKSEVIECRWMSMTELETVHRSAVNADVWVFVSLETRKKNDMSD